MDVVVYKREIGANEKESGAGAREGAEGHIMVEIGVQQKMVQ